MKSKLLYLTVLYLLFTDYYLTANNEKREHIIARAKIHGVKLSLLLFYMTGLTQRICVADLRETFLALFTDSKLLEDVKANLTRLSIPATEEEIKILEANLDFEIEAWPKELRARGMKFNNDAFESMSDGNSYLPEIPISTFIENLKDIDLANIPGEDALMYFTCVCNLNQTIHSQRKNEGILSRLESLEEMVRNASLPSIH